MFSGHQVYKVKNVDLIRDCNFFIDRLNGKTFTQIANENNFSTSRVRSRIYAIERRTRNLACRFDDKYRDIFYFRLYEDKNDSVRNDCIRMVICIVEDYKQYIYEALKTNTLYKPFKKDLIPVRHICPTCGK
jgi:hypothetical protein